MISQTQTPISLKKYLSHCKNCGKKQPCYIRTPATIRTKCLLMCSKCGKDIERRISFNRLVESQPTTPNLKENTNGLIQNASTNESEEGLDEV